jgi:FSR family fosmidomycin resistance protein-like MFS transporter
LRSQPETKRLLGPVCREIGREFPFGDAAGANQPVAKDDHCTGDAVRLRRVKEISARLQHWILNWCQEAPRPQLIGNQRHGAHDHSEPFQRRLDRKIEMLEELLTCRLQSGDIGSGEPSRPRLAQCRCMKQRVPLQILWMGFLTFLFLGASSNVAMLATALILGGIGSSTQHPIASSLVAAAYEGPRSRGALGTYNFAGDVGKMALPAIAACLIAVMSWRSAAAVIGVIGMFGAGIILLVLRHGPTERAVRAGGRPTDGKVHERTSLLHNGFPLLLAIGVIDSATRMGFLTFLPFLLRAKGAGVPEIGVALTLLFGGGAAGKLVCGFLGARLGVLPTVLLTEGATAAGIVALLPLPFGLALALLPIIGVALNGTSSVLYGTVPDLVTVQQRETAFGVFYTGTIGAGALSPAVYGLLGDAIGLIPAMLLVAVVVLLTLPLAWQLTRAQRPLPQGDEASLARSA